MIDPFSDAPRPERDVLARVRAAPEINPSVGGQTRMYSHGFYSIDLSY